MSGVWKAEIIMQGHGTSQDQQNIIGYSGETKMGRKDRRHVRALENEN